MKKKKEHDFSVTAFRVVQEATEGVDDQPKPQPRKFVDPVTAGRLGGLKDGKAKAEKLSPERRKEIAIKAASAGWGK